NIAKGRATQGAAVALLGKVYIYLKDWQNALTYLNKVSDYGYALESNFADLWTLNNENNEEVIFSMKYTATTNGHVMSSDFIPYFGVEGISATGLETADLSWSLHKKFEDADTRKAATITEYWRAPGSTDAPSWRPYISKFAVPHSGASSGLDIPVLRFADIILLKAEALYHLNEPDAALTELNKVRTRAFGDTSHNYQLSDISTLDLFIDKLLLERQLELALENQRWFDLVRTDRFMQELAEVEWSYNNTTQTAQVVQLNPQPHHRYFPIPQHEIDQSEPGVLVQNDGYIR
ncbi:MAG TPA: RagB/SusD family nutrient uptake outer membrane protein, partial [Chryseosolibacter sp.]|nr:RagB/SusD family nutrient uptake outer membrane protein [Chryseosolibacter sp.]